MVENCAGPLGVQHLEPMGTWGQKRIRSYFKKQTILLSFQAKAGQLVILPWHTGLIIGSHLLLSCPHHEHCGYRMLLHPISVTDLPWLVEFG